MASSIRRGGGQRGADEQQWRRCYERPGEQEPGVAGEDGEGGHTCPSAGGEDLRRLRAPGDPSSAPGTSREHGFLGNFGGIGSRRSDRPSAGCSHRPGRPNRSSSQDHLTRTGAAERSVMRTVHPVFPFLSQLMPSEFTRVSYNRRGHGHIRLTEGCTWRYSSSACSSSCYSLGYRSRLCASTSGSVHAPVARRSLSEGSQPPEALPCNRLTAGWCRNATCR